MLLICQQRFLFNVFYVFYFFHKIAFFNVFILGVNVFYIYDKLHTHQLIGLNSGLSVDDQRFDIM